MSHGADLSFVEARRDLLARPGRPSAARRSQLGTITDTWLRQIFAQATGRSGPDAAGLALVASGSYGSRELSPGSDLDLMLLHVPGIWAGPSLVEVADAVWYPVWDSGVRLDHAVRTPESAAELAGTDLSVLLSLLDARTLAGDARLLERVRAQALADWRGAAAQRLPALREMAQARGERHGSLAYSLEPDLKNGRGGLRDLTVLRAVAASWVADRPHGSLSGVRAELLDVRDALHLVTGRHGDVLRMQEHSAVAERLGMPDADAVLARVGTLGREVAYAADTTWRRVEQVQGRSTRRWSRGRSSVLRPVGQHLMESGGEIVLAPGTDLGDPMLPLRAAAAAARGGMSLNPAMVKELAAAAPGAPEVWPPAGRQALLTLLSAGFAAVPLWEALDDSGLITRLFPEWTEIRHRRQRNPVHAWTVDRHSWETAAYASALTRRVGRPDLLLLAALFHDLGKGAGEIDHPDLGAELVIGLCTRLGLDKSDTDIVATLVRHHLLLLSTATRRDLDDPASVAGVAEAVGSPDVLELLSALAEADAQATGPSAWTMWKAALLDTLVARVRAALQGMPVPELPPLSAEHAGLAERGQLAVTVAPETSGCTVTVIAPDRRGLLADVAGVLALHQLSVKSASLGSVGEMAVDTWFVEPEYGDVPDPGVLRDAIGAALAGSLDVAAALARREADRRRRATNTPVATVSLVPGASETATVLEVRAPDRLGLLHDLARVVTRSGLDVRAARVDTVGDEVVDVFYVVDAGAALGSAAVEGLVRALTAVA